MILKGHSTNRSRRSGSVMIMRKT